MSSARPRPGSLPDPETDPAPGRRAIQRGCAALDADDRAGATRWFERARRLAPNDPSALFLLASCLAEPAPLEALALLDTLLARVPRQREARVSRIAILHRLGDPVRAAAELDTLLGRFAAPRGEAFAHLADAVAAAARAAGWIGVRGDGYVVLGARPVRLRLGRRRLLAPATATAARLMPLPAGWEDAGTLMARAPDGRLLGHAIDLAAILRVEGVVSLSADGVLSGWALAPADPEAVPAIEVTSGETGAVLATGLADDDSVAPVAGDGAARARGFSITLPEAARQATLHVRARGGAALMGSPVRLAEEAGACRAAAQAGEDRWRPLPVALASVLPPPARATPERRPIDVVIPLFRGAAAFAACLASLGDDLPAATRIVAVDDGIVDADLRRLAERAAEQGRIVLLRHATNRGFPAAANTGLRHAAGRDVILLNSDTVLPPGAVRRLAACGYACAGTGTVTPMTTDGTLTTRGVPGVAEPMPDAASVARMDAALHAANGDLHIALPTCVGFCVFIRHDCLAQTGLLREDAFAQGYGEENDFSLRAAQLGWRHVAACGVLVAHAGGASFGSAGGELRGRNQAVLERLHPGYGAMVAAWIAGDPLAPARFAAEALAWEGGRMAQSVVLVTHATQGGVERHVAARAAAAQAAGQRAIVVRPGDRFAISDGTAATHPNLRFASVEELAAFLRPDRPALVELHHTAAHDPTVARLAGLLRASFDVIVHDYAAICPRVTLVSGEGRFCGEPADRQVCEDCVADHGARIPLALSVAQHRASQAMILRAARHVIAPSRDAADRLRRFVPKLAPQIAPWEDDAALAAGVRLPQRRPGAAVCVAVVGSIGEDKGFAVLLACARDAARRDLPLRFVLVGHSIDDERLLATQRAFVTGRFAEGEAPALLRRFAPDLGLLPSVWPETWCFALSALWRAGLHVTAFDLGAQAERIRAAAAGSLLPLGTAAPRVNDHLLALASGRQSAAPARTAEGPTRAAG